MYRCGSVFVVRYSFNYTEPPIFRGGRQNLRFLSFYQYAEPPILEDKTLLLIFLKLRRTSEFGV